MPGEGRLFKLMNDMTVKVKSSQTNGTYEICEEKCPPGFMPHKHMQTKDFETFYIVSGSATCKVSDETVDAVKGTGIHIPPDVPHEVQSAEGCEMLASSAPASRKANSRK